MGGLDRGDTHRDSRWMRYRRVAVHPEGCMGQRYGAEVWGPSGMGPHFPPDTFPGRSEPEISAEKALRLARSVDPSPCPTPHLRARGLRKRRTPGSTIRSLASRCVFLDRPIRAAATGPRPPCVSPIMPLPPLTSRISNHGIDSVPPHAARVAEPIISYPPPHCMRSEMPRSSAHI